MSEGVIGEETGITPADSSTPSPHEATSLSELEQGNGTSAILGMNDTLTVQKESTSISAIEQIELSEYDTDDKNSPKDDEAAQEEAAQEVAIKTKRVRQRLWTTVLSAIVACIPFLLVGCTLGFPSGALLDLTDLEERTEFKLTREQADLFGALGYIGAVFGGPIAGWISDRMGRKPALMLVSVPYLTGYMMITYARFAVDPVLFKVILLIGRFFSGVGLGWASLAVVVYVVEMAPSKMRGMIGSIIQLFLVLGILSVYTLSSFDSVRYYDTSLVMVGFVVLFTVSMVFFCETPRWLLAHGQKKRAIAVLKFLRGPRYDFKEELETIESAVKKAKKFGPKQVLKEFSKCNILIPQILTLLLALFRVCSGLEAINPYSATILRNAGVEQFREVSVYGTGCTRLITNLSVVFIADLVGRKILLIASGIGMFVGTTALGVHFYITRPSLCVSEMLNNNMTLLNDTMAGQENALCNEHLAPFAIVALVVYNIGFAIGWGPILWVVVGELMPLSVRGIGTGITVFVTWGLAAVVAGSYLSLVRAIQPWFVWWIYSALNFTSILFVIFCIFETRGRSLEDIQLRYKKKYGSIQITHPSTFINQSK